MQKRLPFDPGRVPGEPTSPRAARREKRKYGTVSDAAQLTVSQLAELIKATLEQRITSPIRVVGEISNLSRRGHLYFSLKDDSAVVQCVAWASNAKRFGFEPTDGMEVVASGSVSHFPPQGRTQLYVTALKPVGQGALDAQFRQLCDELRRAGYFDDARKKPLPVMPRRIAVVTSAKGAAVRDVIDTAQRRLPAVGLTIVDVRVQGEGAATEIADAIRWVDHHAELLCVDAILVTRGGGSLEDLWTFNEREVADAVLECRLPVVAAIGHESDTTIIELVADARGATPTQAATMLVPDRTDLMRQIAHLRDRLDTTLRHRLVSAVRHVEQVAREIHHATLHRLARARQKLDRLSHAFLRLHPHSVLAKRRTRLDVLADRLHRAAAARVDQRQKLIRIEHELNTHTRAAVRTAYRIVDGLERELRAIDPREVLRRGYSMTTRADGSLIRSAAEVGPGSQIDTHFADGIIRSVVGGQRTRRRDKRQGKGSQMDLFKPGE